MKQYQVKKVNDQLVYVLVTDSEGLARQINSIEKDVVHDYKNVIIDNIVSVGDNSTTRFFLIAIREGKFDIENAVFSNEINKLVNSVEAKTISETITKVLLKNQNFIRNSIASNDFKNQLFSIRGNQK
jgi:hypothetical protein